MKQLFTAALFTLLVIVHPESLSAEVDPTLRALFSPLPATSIDVNNHLTSKRIALGKKLYFEKKLSKAQDLSCNSCHDLNNFGVDNQKTSLGFNGQRGGRNSPTVYNAALHFAQFWDGRAKDVEEQALGPIMNPVEMAMPSEKEVIDRLLTDSVYISQFKEAFPDESEALNFKNIGKAIGAFERTLITPSKFDEYLNGDEKALSEDAIRGLKAFRDTGCVACHNGSTLGGQMFQKLGIVKPFPTSDLGRYEVTKLDSDKLIFKVPSLRNVSKTAPYFHDGSIQTLEEAVKLMGEHQLGAKMDERKIKDIVAFLNSLTGEIPITASLP